MCEGIGPYGLISGEKQPGFFNMHSIVTEGCDQASECGGTLRVN